MTTDRPWLAAYGEMPAHIDADAHPSVVALLESALQCHADKTAFVSFGQRYRPNLPRLAVAHAISST